MSLSFREKFLKGFRKYVGAENLEVHDFREINFLINIKSEDYKAVYPSSRRIVKSSDFSLLQKYLTFRILLFILCIVGYAE